MLFSLPEMVSDKKIRVDFDSPDISSNGGLVLIGNMQDSLAWQIGQLIPDFRKKEFIHHTYMEMVSQRIGQILCGYEDANDCNQLRSDSALKMSVGRKPSDSDLSSQSTMTRLENCVDSKTLYKIGKLFLDEYISSFEKAPKKVIIDGDDTNANTYGAQQLTLFNAYYNEYCYMPMLLFDGLTGKLMLPLLRPGRRNKSLSVARIILRVVEYLHEHWPNTVIELRATAISSVMSLWTGRMTSGTCATLRGSPATACSSPWWTSRDGVQRTTTGKLRKRRMKGVRR